MEEIIVGTRQSGKTLYLIQKSAATGLYIMTANKKRADELYRWAKNHCYSIPYPVTPEDYFRNKFDGSIVRRRGLYIDDADDILQKIFENIEIKSATISTPNVFRLGKDIEIVDSKSWLGANPHLQTLWEVDDERL